MVATSLQGRWWWRSLVFKWYRTAFSVVLFALKTCVFYNCLSKSVSNIKHFTDAVLTGWKYKLGVMVSSARVCSLAFLTRPRTAILEMTRPAIALAVICRMLPFSGYFISNVGTKSKGQWDFRVWSSFFVFVEYCSPVIRNRLRRPCWKRRHNMVGPKLNPS